MAWGGPADLSPLGRVEEKSHGNWGQVSDLGDWDAHLTETPRGERGRYLAPAKCPVST